MRVQFKNWVWGSCAQSLPAVTYIYVNQCPYRLRIMSLVHNTEKNSIQSSKRLGGGEEDMMEAYSIGKVRDGTEVFSDHYDDVDSSGDEIDDPDNRVQGENGKRKRVRKSKLLTEAEKNERR